jgi:hypothetical protein
VTDLRGGGLVGPNELGDWISMVCDQGRGEWTEELSVLTWKT